ncbi:hypothetical protein SDC9_124798 [bioreactor metagenome]|uniref:Uncharacterized protein n=1 Tax=bioreactor metagenome TaxID=1076179 RepID=A0A645CLB0_9ZZZZ|nr:hypothetical protein [Candidatus Metalachnospira sp.]
MMKKIVLFVGMLISLVVGVMGLLMVLTVSVAQPGYKDTALVSASIGIPSLLLIVLFTFLFRKYKKDFPKTTAEIEYKERMKTARKEKQERQKDEKQRIKEEEKAAKVRALDESKNNLFNIPHIAGLPLAEGSLCNIHYGTDEFKIYGGGNNFHLQFEKVTDICIKTNEEIQKSYVSSVGGAVGGAVLFGPLGAMIGGRAKEKTAINKTNYLIVTYIKNDNIDYIGFEVKDQLKMAQEWVNRFDPSCAATGKDIAL